MAPTFCPWSLAACLLVLAVDASAVTVAGGGIALDVDAALQVTAVRAAGTALPVSAAPLVTLREAEKTVFVAPAVGSGSLPDGLALEFAEGKVSATLTAREERGVLRFTCRLAGDAALPARGMLLRFALPIDAIDWQWHQDMQTAVPIAAGQRYENVRPLRAFADLPEWRDEPTLRLGYSSVNFCTAVTGPAGVCLAVRMDRPCVFRTAYDGAARALHLVYDFALSPDTRQPNQVEFAFDLYAFDPAWGFRGALEVYYRTYPEFFRDYFGRPGQWMAFSRLSSIDNANEFGFALQEGAPEPEYDDRIGVKSAIYLTHAGMFANIPNHDPEKEPMPAFDVQVAAMAAAFKKTTGQDGVFAQVGLHTATDQLDIRKASVYGHLLAQFNLDPELPYGAFTLQRAVTLTETMKQKRNADLDGFYYDGLSTGINYRADHFKTADAPCLWDPVAKKPFLSNFFCSCKFARAAAEMLRARGQVSMMNGGMGESFFIMPWLDVLGEETGLRIPRASLNLVRTTTHHKPFMTLLKGNYEQKIGRAEMELFMKRCLAYGIFPGFFDWPPSGLGPGGRYWDHARYYERDRDLHRTYQPLCRALAMAGWEPVTHARSSEPRVLVERFGPAPDTGVAWLTLLNEDNLPRATRLSINAQALGLDAAGAGLLDLVSQTPIAATVADGQLVADVAVPADGVMALQLATPANAARWRVQQCLETLDAGVQMRTVDQDKPALPVHWRRQGPAPDRYADGDKTCLVFAGPGTTTQSCSQWVMLFQDKPAPVTLRVRAAAESLTGDQGTIGVYANIAWVTRRFTHYDKRFLDLPTGTYEWRDVEFTIDLPQPLRAIEIVPQLRAGAKGTLRIARVSVSDANRAEYAVDPEFGEWYEPIPAPLRPDLDTGCQTLRASLVALRAVATDITATAAREALAAVQRGVRTLRDRVVQAHAENGCRRLWRDLETIERHLGPVALAAYDIACPRIQGPATAPPGETVTLTFAAPPVAGVPVRTELRADIGRITPAASGAALSIPADTPVGGTVHITGVLHLGAAGQEVTVRTAHAVAVRPALDVAPTPTGVDPATGSFAFRATVHNNRQAPVVAKLALSAPGGWRTELPGAVTVDRMAAVWVTPRLTPEAGAKPRLLDVCLTATAGADTAGASLTLMHIPKDANRLKNPGFEDGAAGWQTSQGAADIDTGVCHSGGKAVRLSNPAVTDSAVTQTVTFEQVSPCPVLVRASAKGRDVSGSSGAGFSLYVDTYYTDGTKLYGRRHDFQTGTTDWALGEVYIEPAKPIHHVSVHCLLRGKSGTAWFDDLALFEDPLRKGNLATLANVETDSCYERYDPSPLNDGVTQVAGLHWSRESWASAEIESEHFAVLRFDAPKTVAMAVIHWSLDAGIPRTSAEVQIQVQDGDGWRSVATAKPDGPTPRTEIILDPPATASAFMFLQPPGKGPAGRPHLMWVREIELIPGP